VADAFRDRFVKAYQASGERLGLSMWPVEVKTPEDIEPAFAKIAQDSANNGIIVGAGGLTFVLGLTSPDPMQSHTQLSHVSRNKVGQTAIYLRQSGPFTTTGRPHPVMATERNLGRFAS
jgi:hypothetical protein